MLLDSQLTQLRKKKKLTQQELADRLNISRSTYAQYEIGRRQPDYETLQKIADFFEVTTDHLLGRDQIIEEKKPTRPFTDIEKDLIGSLELDDDEIIKNFPMTYKGRELSEEEKRRVIAVARAVFLSDQDTRRGS